MRAETIDPLEDRRWLDLLAQAPHGSVFHHPAWLRLLVRTYGYRLAAPSVVTQDGRLAAALPIAAIDSRLTGRRLVALPFSDICPPLIAADAPPSAGPLLNTALDTFRRERGLTLEIRAGGEGPPGSLLGERFHHHVLTLDPDVCAVERGFLKSQVRRGVRRAQRAGLHASFDTDRDALTAFYRLHTATRRRLGVPTQPRRFILGFEPLLREGLGFVATVRHGERPVAAALFLVHGDVLTYKYGASDAGALTMRPNNLLFMEAIRWGCEHGMRTLDFGRTHWGQEGLCAFKRAWGATEHELRYHLLGGEAAREPGRRAQRIVGALIRSTPAATGRAIGEVFYRHAA